MKTQEEILERAAVLEREARELHSQQKTEGAFSLFDEAASFYSKAGEHLKSALCYASAATCWNIRTGWQPLRNAATRNELAARESVKGGNYEYAHTLFQEAALLFEKEGDFSRYSTCFYEMSQVNAKIQWEIFMRGRIDKQDVTGKMNLKERFSALGRWVINRLNFLLWGYGERPFRTFWLATAVIFLSALAYSFSGQVLTGGEIRAVSFLEGLYMSTITYTTVGFGDYLPLGWTRALAVFEASLGIFLAPLFLIGLTRRYLRTRR